MHLLAPLDQRTLDLCLANCYFAHNSLRFPALLPFFNASSLRPFHPPNRRPDPVVPTWRRPFPRCRVPSAQTPAPDRESLPQRSPNLSSWDRILVGWMALLVRPARLLRSAIVLKPSTLLALRLLPYCFFDARVGEQPHDGDHNVAGAGDPRPHERQGNCRSVDHDRQCALSVISNRCRQR